MAVMPVAAQPLNSRRGPAPSSNFSSWTASDGEAVALPDIELPLFGKAGANRWSYFRTWVSICLKCSTKAVT